MMGYPAFEGASTEIRLERKGLISTDDNSNIAARELKHLWKRSHHLCRNNPGAITAKKRLCAHWIGDGIKVRWSNKAMQAEWDKFISNPSVDGYGDIYNLQHTWASALFESGEVFSIFRIVQREDSRIPLKIQTLEAEYLDPLYYQPENTKNGITFGAFGQPLTYHFFKQFPSIGLLMPTGFEFSRVDVPAYDVIHIFERQRPGEWRGIPRLAPVILPLYEMDELTDATLVRQKVAQAVGWIIRKREAGPLPAMGSSPVIDRMVGDNISGTANSKKISKITPGGVHYLADDEDFTFATVDDIGNNLLILLQHEWRMIAAALDVTYEMITGDLSQVNFSSIRAGIIEFRKRVAVMQQLILINLGMKPLCERFKQLASLYVSSSAGSATYQFVLPKVDEVDPLKDVQADVLEIRAGLATLQEKLAERGIQDFDAHIAQIAKEQGLDVVLASNPKIEQSLVSSKGDNNVAPDTKEASDTVTS